MWVEGNREKSAECAQLFTPLNYGLEIIDMFVTKNNVIELKEQALYTNPDVLSLDIDGNDYYVAESILSAEIKPKIFIVEYNSAFGPEMSVTIAYQEDFQVTQGYGENLYYGCSISAWKKLFLKFGYFFVTVDTNGVNAIFINPEEFDADFVKNISGKDYAENFSQLREYGVYWDKQFALIGDRDLFQVD
jgi:hypothetical protein